MKYEFVEVCWGLPVKCQSCVLGPSFQFFSWEVQFFLIFWCYYWKIGKKQHFICSDWTLFLVPFFSFFFFFSISLWATSLPSHLHPLPNYAPVANRPTEQKNAEHSSKFVQKESETVSGEVSYIWQQGVGWMEQAGWGCGDGGLYYIVYSVYFFLNINFWTSYSKLPQRWSREHIINCRRQVCWVDECIRMFVLIPNLSYLNVPSLFFLLISGT